ncbi:hypothetical protein [Cohnella abietis]|nr:hypothetical protein [Cohnella abietis]
MTTLLIVTVVIIYTSVIQGDEGTKTQIKNSGGHMAEQISRISP